MNERNEERIVYNHFEKFVDYIEIEQQTSKTPKINKLLKNASKSGIGIGRPEFIITYKENSNFLIVVECKSKNTKHESVKKDKYSEYAVDGVLLYASYLSKGYDVLAIAVSGETKEELKISHFLHLKDEQTSTEIFGNEFLSPQNYLEEYLKTPEKFRQDYDSILDFTKKINEKLHSLKILENQRGLLLSGILMALEDDAFRKSYPVKTNAKSLAKLLTNTIEEKLNDAKLDNEKVKNLINQFNFINTDKSLSNEENVLKNLIDDVEDNINKFNKTYQYVDVLGQLYIEFLQYANSDKGLGIVLTPPHITELFVELAQVNKKSIVYDNCAGTGGFLISAMKKMIKDANGNTETINNIKTNQLFGVEYHSHIYALTVSNMYIHQDGKTNILNGDCFEKVNIEIIKSKKPTIGLLNPPYKGDKKTDKDELEFLLNNLECLVEGGTCIALVPMQSAISQNSKVIEFKKKILENHTLEAVLSMPNELFFNSKVSVITSAMVFTAKKPHPKNKETYFGYYKDDGFIKNKIKGRHDGKKQWDIIKNKWISNFINRKEEKGFSLNKIVKPEDEWCIEAFLETDYSKINQDTFINEIKKYLAFKIINQ